MILGESLAEILEDKEAVIVSGKGGTGKSTMSTMISCGLMQAGNNVLTLDTDPSHSILDAFGFPLDITDDDKARLVRVAELMDSYVDLLMTHEIVPEVYEDDEKHTELNRLLTALVKNIGLLPLLRIVIHPKFFGPSEGHENTARVLQLVEVLMLNNYYEIDTSVRGEERLSYESLPVKPDKVLVDSENTKGLLRIITRLEYFRKTIEMLKHRTASTLTVNPRELWERGTTQLTLSRQKSLGDLAGSDVVKLADFYGGVLSNAQSKLVDATKTAVVIVTQPGWTDLNQTRRELKDLGRWGVTPAAVILNKCAAFPDDTPGYLQAYQALEGYDETPLIPVYSKMQQVDPARPEEAAEVVAGNARLLTKELGFPSA